MSFKRINQIFSNFKRALKGTVYPKMKNLYANLYAFVSFVELTFYLYIYCNIFWSKFHRRKFFIQVWVMRVMTEFSFWGELSL